MVKSPVKMKIDSAICLILIAYSVSGETPCLPTLQFDLDGADQIPMRT